MGESWLQPDVQCRLLFDPVRYRSIEIKDIPSGLGPHHTKLPACNSEVNSTFPQKEGHRIQWCLRIISSLPTQVTLKTTFRLPCQSNLENFQRVGIVLIWTTESSIAQQFLDTLNLFSCFCSHELMDDVFFSLQ